MKEVNECLTLKSSSDSPEKSIDEAESELWTKRGREYALDLLCNRGLSPREILDSLRLGLKDLYLADIDLVIRVYADLAYESRRDERRRCFLAGVLSVAVECSGLRLGIGERLLGTSDQRTESDPRRRARA